MADPHESAASFLERLKLARAAATPGPWESAFHPGIIRGNEGIIEHGIAQAKLSNLLLDNVAGIQSLIEAGQVLAFVAWGLWEDQRTSMDDDNPCKDWEAAIRALDGPE